MITGQLLHWRSHFSGQVWERAFSHLESLGPDAPEGLTELMGLDMYARVMSYQTVEPPDAKLEAHQDYIDIQCSLIEGERIDWFPLSGLVATGNYNPEKDVQNFHRPGPALISVCVLPGMYAVLYPEDAHMPKLIIHGSRLIKKVVIKLRKSLLDNATAIS